MWSIYNIGQILVWIDFLCHIGGDRLSKVQHHKCFVQCKYTVGSSKQKAVWLQKCIYLQKLRVVIEVDIWLLAGFTIVPLIPKG